MALREVMFAFPVYSVYLSLQLLCFSENIRSITDLVEPEDDCRTITAVHDRIDKESTERRKEFEKAHANLKGLSLLDISVFYMVSCQRPSSRTCPRCRPHVLYAPSQRAFRRTPRRKPQPPRRRSIIPRQGVERRRERRRE